MRFFSLLGLLSLPLAPLHSLLILSKVKTRLNCFSLLKEQAVKF